MDRLTMAVATGSAIAWGGQEAYDAWRRSRDLPAAVPRAVSPEARMAAVGHVAAMFPGAVRIRRPGEPSAAEAARAKYGRPDVPPEFAAGTLEEFREILRAREAVN